MPLIFFQERSSGVSFEKHCLHHGLYEYIYPGRHIIKISIDSEFQNLIEGWLHYSTIFMLVNLLFPLFLIRLPFRVVQTFDIQHLNWSVRVLPYLIAIFLLSKTKISFTILLINRENGPFIGSVIDNNKHLTALA